MITYMESDNKVITSERNEVTDRHESVFTLQREKQAALKYEPVEARALRLQTLSVALKAYEKELLEALLKDTGKSILESAFMELGALYKRIDTEIARVEEMVWESEPAESVTLIIGPSNYPVFLLLCPLIQAIAEGNSCILKPSELTPSVGELLVKMISSYFDPTAVAVFEGGNETLTSLLKLPFDHIFFTGNYTTGRMVMAAAARNLSSADIELTGKTPVIIDEDTDLDRAAEKIVYEKFLNAGQNAIAPDYVFVHESRKNVFVAALMARIRRFYEENTYDLNMDDYSRITDDRNFERLRILLNDAIKQGAAIVMGGTINAGERIFHPTILTNVSYDSSLIKEEIFGPILPVFTYHHIDEVTDYISSNDKYFALYPFSKNKPVSHQIRSRDSTADLC